MRGDALRICARWLVAMAAALASAPGVAAEGSARGNVVISGLRLGVEDAGPFNPGNLIARLPERGVEGEARLDVRGAAGPCEVLVKPRLRWTQSEIGDTTTRDTEAFMNAASLKCRHELVELSAGRLMLQWGNGQFRSPSNPFFAESVRFNPVQEILGKDFAVLAYQPTLTWRAAYIAHLDESHLDAGSQEFLRAHAVKLDWTGNAAVAGAILSQRHSRPIRIGGYGTLTLSDSTLLYGEAGVSRDAEGSLPVLSATGVVGMLPAYDVDPRRRYSVLAGGAYTFVNGITMNVEYLRTTEGFTDAQAADWLELARRAGAGLSGPDAALAAAQLGAAADPGWRQLRSDYLFVQWVRNEWHNRMDVALRVVRNLDDHGTELSGTVSVSLGDHAQWFVFGSRNYGGADTEFGRLQRYALQTGIRLYGF